MFKGFFNKFKKEQHNEIHSSNLIFKSSVGAFDYAEKYFNTPICFDFNEIYLGLVIGVEGK